MLDLGEEDKPVLLRESTESTTLLPEPLTPCRLLSSWASISFLPFSSLLSFIVPKLCQAWCAVCVCAQGPRASIDFPIPSVKFHFQIPS